MRRLIILSLIISLAIPVFLIAGTRGTLKGTVLDKDGKGVIGATIYVMGTTRGTSVKSPDGSFIIANIPAGDYEVRFSAVGKAKLIKKLRISADKTTETNVVLVEEGTMTEELIVEAETFEINAKEQGSVDVVSSEDILNNATQSLAGVVTRAAGVQGQGGGFSIRGSRSEDTQIRVDGIDVSDKLTGGMGPGGTRYTPMISSLAVSEVQVVKGGFSAEYGEVLGGVVNSVMKTGKTNRYEGYVQYETDLPSLNGSQHAALKIERTGDRLQIIDEGDGYKFQGANEQNMDIGIGGPIPGLNDLIPAATFFINTNYLYEEFRNNSYEIYDPSGNNLGQYENNQTWVRNMEGRLRFALTQNIELTLGGGWGMTNAELMGWSWLYNDEPGVVFNGMRPQVDGNGDFVTNDIPAYQAKLPAWNISNTRVLARLNHTLSNSMYYQLEFNTAINGDATSRRNSLDDPGFFSGFDLVEPEDNLQAGIYNPNQAASIADFDWLVPGDDQIVDHYTGLFFADTSADGFYAFQKPQPNPLTGYVEGNRDLSGHNNPYGLQGIYAGFQTVGNQGFSFRRTNLVTFKGHLEKFLKTGDFQHSIKTGFSFRSYSLRRHQNGNPWDGQPFYDVYTDEWGGNIYAENADLRAKTSEPFNPMQLAVYVQDQIEYKGIIFSPGVRFDYFNPNEDHRVYDNDNIQFITIVEEEFFQTTDPKFQVSPRINVSYPITQTSNILFSYGQFFKMPEFQFMYDNFNISLVRAGSSIGNTNLQPQRTNMYEITYQSQISKDFIIEATTYFKDIYNQLGLSYYEAVPEPFFEYTVAEYGNAKGLELNLRKRRADNIAFNLNYSLGYVTGTSSSPNSNASRQIDPFTNQFALPLAAYPLNWDVRHRVKADLSVFWDNDEGPSIGGFQILENSNWAFQFTYRSGFPYTQLERNGTIAGELNAERGPSFWNVNFRMMKNFMLRDWFGDSWNYSALQVFVRINNILNRTVPTSVYAATADPDDPGRALDRQIGDFPGVTYYRDADPTNPATFSTTQYDYLGNRRYNENADFDNNGTLTQAEHYQAYINYLEDAMAFRGNYSIPRTVFVGFNIQF